MNITAQDGVEYCVQTVKMQGDTIYGVTKTEDVILGRYPTMRRACEVFSEITYIGWSKDNGTYEIPVK